jgi:hypothetical protein
VKSLTGGSLPEPGVDLALKGPEPSRASDDDCPQSAGDMSTPRTRSHTRSSSPEHGRWSAYRRIPSRTIIIVQRRLCDAEAVDQAGAEYAIRVGNVDRTFWLPAAGLPSYGSGMRRELDAALARAKERAETERRGEARATREAAERARIRDEEDSRLIAEVQELATELVRRAEAMGIPKNRVIKVWTTERSAWKSKAVQRELAYWFVTIPGSEPVSIPQRLLIDSDANLYWETGSGHPPELITRQMPRVRCLSNFNVELVADWLAGKGRETWVD